MGQLTNQYVSSSYQGLLKMTDSTTGVTPTLQTVQTGDGTNTPLQISQTEVNISGSFSINNIPFSIVNTGSFVSTSSFNAYTSSIDTRIDGIEVETGSLQSQINGLNVETGSLQNQINGLATTSSLTSLSSSIAVTDLSQNNRLTSIEGITGSLATTSSLTSLSSSIATTDLGQDNRLGSLETKTGSYATTGSNIFIGNQTITGSVNQTGSMAIRGTDGTTPVILTVGHPNMGPLTIKNNGEISTFQSIQGIGMQNINTSPSNISFTNGVGDISIYGKFQTGSVILGLNQSSKAIVTGSLSVSNGITGSLQGTASYATQALSASWAPDNSNRNGVITTGSVGGNQSITGSLGISGTLTALSASITYLETVYETASIIYSSGSNQFGDASNDTQTLWGTVNLPSGPLVVTGSVTATNFTGSLEGTASYATQALSASYAPTILPNGVVSGSQQILDLGFATTSSVNTKLDTGSFNTYSGDTLNLINQKLDTGSFNTYTASIDARTGSYITTGSAASSQSITGSLILSGSAGIELDVKGDQLNTGSLSVRSGSLSTISNNTTVNIDLYLTNSLGGQSNIIKGWGENPAAGGAGATQSNYTGSLRITGSNNTISLPQLRATGVGGGADLQGYISGSDNMLMSNNSGIYLNTGSLLFPKTTNNFIGANSSMLLNFTTSSLAGGHPLIQNNTLYAGQIAINSNSGSISVGGNVVNGGSVTSTQNFVTNVRPSIGQNIINGAGVTLNHISSSINYNSNINNSPVTINNHLSSSITSNILNVTNNTILGGSSNTGLNIWVSGSQNSNAARQVIDNLIGGKNIIVSSSFVSSSVANLNASLVYGQGLGIIANHSGNLGGTAIVGRFNDTGSLGLAQDVVFAVGTGTAAANRRTGLYVTSGSLVGVSGSLDVKGNSVMTGSLTVSGSNADHSIIGARLFLSASLYASSSFSHDIVGTQINITGNTQMSGNGDFPLTVNGTINSKRLHFTSNPFNSNPSSNLGALRFDGNNQQFYLTNYDLAQITTQSIVATIVNTGSAFVETSLGANNRGVDTYLKLTNVGGTGSLSTNVNTIVTGSLRVTGDVMFTSGSNTTMGTVALDGANPGVATVSNTLVTANSLIYLTKQTNNHPNAGPVVVSSKGSSTFSITSNHNGDTDTVAYLIINPA